MSLFEKAKKEAKPLEKSIIKETKKPNKDTKPTSLFDKFRTETKDSKEIMEEFVLKSWKFRKLTEKKKDSFNAILADTLRIASERGIGIVKGTDQNLDIEQSESKIGIYRSKGRKEEIDKLLMFDSLVLDDLPLLKVNFPTKEEININTDVESPSRECIHLAFDIETDKHQHPIAMGVYNHEAKRFIVWLKSNQETIKTYKTLTENGYFHIVKCPNPVEALFLGDIENVYGQILLSALAQDQKELYSILSEIAIDKFPFSFEILKKFLFHEILTIPFCHSAKFDVNGLINMNNKCKEKGFSFIMPKLKPKTLKLYYGKNYTTQESIGRNFSKSLGNITAGFRYGLDHNIKYHKFLGIPKISLHPIQESSIPSSYAVDTLLLAMALQFQKPDDPEIEGKFSLQAIAHGTPFEKMKEFDHSKKIFTIEDFYVTENKQPSLQLKYLMYDCFSNLTGYANLTHKLPLQKLFDTLQVRKEFWFEKPVVATVISTASIAKMLLFALLKQKTGLSQKQIETNIETERHYLKPFDKIEKVYFEDGERKSTFFPTFTGARIQTSVYGKVTPEGDKTIEFSDFASQYPHQSRLILAFMQYVEASKGILHKRIVQDKQIIETTIWNIVERLIKDIDAGEITEAPFCKINGIVKINSKYRLQLRQKVNNRKNDVLVKGNILTTFSDLIGAILRNYYNNNKSLIQLKKHIKIKSGIFLNFHEKEIAKFGKEFFTQLYVLRQEFQLQKDFTIEQLLKIIINASYGIGAEGISREDYTGKLFIPPIPNGITATARLTNTIAEIIYIKLGGTPLYTHTDSIISLATKKVHKKVNDLFERIDPLKIETKAPIKWIVFLGKAKYGYMDIEGNFKQKTHGAGSYGGKNVEKAYEMMFKLIYEKNNSVTQAARVAKYHFPLFHQIDVKNNYKFKENDKRKQHGTVRVIRKLMVKGDLLDAIDYGAITLYIYEYTKQLKTKVKHTYLITTTDELQKGMFFNSASFGNVKIANFSPINSEKICKFLITQDIPQEIKNKISYHLTNRPKAEKHLQNRFWFDKSRFGLDLPKTINSKIEHRLVYLGKRKKRFLKPISTKVINLESNKSYVQLLNQTIDEQPSYPDVPLIKDDNMHTSDGFSLSGFTKLLDLNFTEYLLGNINQAYTDAIINSARTISVKYVMKKYQNNIEKRDELINKYLYETKFKELPFPKGANSIKVNSLIIPLPHQLNDKDYLEGNIPYKCEKWLLDVIFSREQLNKQILKGILEPIDENDILIKKPKIFRRKYETYFKNSQLTFKFLNYDWLYILKPSTAIDANCYLQINIIVGKNRTFTYKFHLNPTSNKLINFKNMRVNKTKLQEDSGFIKDIMYELFHTNFLTDFKQSRSLNEEDIESKDDSRELIRTIYEIYAQIIIESKIKYSRTKLIRLDLTTDIKADPQIIRNTLNIAEEVMSTVYEEIATSKNSNDELDFRNNIQVSKAKTNNGVFYRNRFKGGRSNLAYSKTRRQLAEKFKRVINKRNIDKKEFKYSRVAEDLSILRVETQIQGFNNINDAYEFETHQYFISWIKSIMAFLEKNIRINSEYNRIRKEIITGNTDIFKKFIEFEMSKENGKGVGGYPPP